MPSARRSTGHGAGDRLCTAPDAVDLADEERAPALGVSLVSPARGAVAGGAAGHRIDCPIPSLGDDRHRMWISPGAVDLFAAALPDIGCVSAETGWPGEPTPSISGEDAKILNLAGSFRNIPFLMAN